MMRRSIGGGLVVLFCLFWAAVPGTAIAQPQGKVILFHAGSLSMPFEAMEKAFEAANPKVDILREPSGSQKAARKVSELNKPCDIMASADYQVIDRLLIPDFANWNVRFATNQIVLSYMDKSRFSKEITADNWHEILQRKEVSWGHSDPNLDPCGYRSLMVIQLAETHYKQPGLYNRLIANRPEANIRPKEVDLISLLQTGHMDYAWEYLSVAVQHGLKYILLPDEINLGSYAHDDRYSQAVVRVTGKEPGTFTDLRGSSCTYGVTLIKTTPNRSAAIAFLTYMLDPQGGLKVLRDMGQPPFVPCRVPTEAMKTNLPEDLKGLVEVKN